MLIESIVDADIDIIALDKKTITMMTVAAGNPLAVLLNRNNT